MTGGIDQGAGDRDALSCAAGELDGQGLGPVGHVDGFEQFVGAGPGFAIRVFSEPAGSENSSQLEIVD